MRYMMISVLALVAVLSPAWAELYPKTGVVVVKITGVTGSGGTVRGYLFNNKDSWLKYDRAVCAASAEANPGQVILRFEKVPIGDRYSLSVYQDENGNGKMDTGSFIPIPTEPVGASNYEGKSMPRYYDCSFFFKTSPQNLTVQLRKI